MISRIQKQSSKPFPKLMIDDEGWVVFFTQEGDGQLVYKPEGKSETKVGDLSLGWKMEEFKDFDPSMNQTAMPLPRLMESESGTIVLFYGPEEGILVYENIEENEPSSVGLVTYAGKDGWKVFNGTVTLSNR